MILEARGLSVSAPIGDVRVDLLRSIEFGLAAGQVLAVVGESGAGKSMIGRVVSRSLPAGFSIGAGTLAFDGADLGSMTDRTLRTLLGDRIAFIPQEPMSALNPLLTIGAQFEEHLARLGVERRRRRARAVDALAEVRLDQPEQVLARYPFQLSGGMCQRVLIAMAFVSNPALVVADEPTTALDVVTQVSIAGLIRRMQRDHGTALLFITHDLRLAAHVADAVMVLYAGDVVERGPARAVLEDPRHPYTRALRAAVPSLTGPLRALRPLPDRMPGLAQLASLPGCRFAPRCPIRDAGCAASRPPLREVAPGHAVSAAVACSAPTPDLRPMLPPPHAPASADPLLAVERVGKTYRLARASWRARGGEAVALKSVDLVVRPGEIVGVVGESGSGKSTLARLVMGLEPPTSGRIVVDGRDVTQISSATRAVRLGALQLVFQDPQAALNPRRRIADSLTDALRIPGKRVSRADRADRARRLLADVGLPAELADRYPSELSGGQKQRVTIGRALCVTPRLIVADEIVSGLDVSVQAQVLDVLGELSRSRGIAVLFISHDLAVVRALCSRLLVMRAGEVVEQGATEAVFAAPRHDYTRALLAAAPPDDFSRPWPPLPP